MADAAESPPGPLPSVLGATEDAGGRADAGEPVAPVRPVGTVSTVTRAVAEVAAPVVQISPRQAPAEKPARTVRVLPLPDGTEALRLDLAVDRERVDVTVTTPVLPVDEVRVDADLAALLPALPSIDVAVAGRTVSADASAPCGRATTRPGSPSCSQPCSTGSAGCAERPTSCWSKAPAAPPK